MPQKPTRKLTLQPEYRKRAYNKERFVPSLKLCGVWLEQAGFQAGNIVTVTVRDEKLIIKTVK